MNNKIKQMIYAALLIALAIIIPIQFGFLRINLGAFTATLASHVPMFMSMLISPQIAIVVGIGSVIGFVFAGTPAVVVARAFTHILVGAVGAIIIRKTNSYTKASIITAPIHGIAEALVVIPFVGFNLYYISVVVLLGTVIHHSVDAIISYGIVKSVAAARKKNIYNVFGEITEKKAA